MTDNIDYDPDALGVPHGWALPKEREALIWARPPQRALDWAAQSLGATRIVRVELRKGGSASAIHLLTADNGERAVLRRFVLEPDPEDGNMAAREAEALTLLRSVPGVPTPSLIEVDETGDAAGSWAVLMTLLPGRVDWAPSRDHLDTFLLRLVEPLLLISDATLPPKGTRHIPPHRPYEWDKAVGGPPWTRLPQSTWDAAAEIYLSPPPTTERRFIHRDYHPGNVLWRRRRVTGVIDWASASLGSPEVDIGHCRANLQGHFSQAIADRFLALWLSMSGRTEYHPYWDLAAVMCEPADYDIAYNRELDEYIAAAMRRL